ncbi:MAG TPA: hypothetical protein VK171_08195, partial [Fimbriimonas sp.]|nr:hypothetical protein [Fimbriimonas sp.]
MRFRLELISRFRFQNTETGHVFALRNGASLLGLLACSPNGIERAAIIQALWHDVTPEISKNRLRVALSKLRDTLGTALIESGTSIQLSPSEVSCDLWDLLDLVEQAKNAIDSTTEFQALEQLVSMIAESKTVLCSEVHHFEEAKLFKSDLDGYLLRALDLGIEHQRYH